VCSAYLPKHSGFVPSVINTFFDTYVMPLVFYFICQVRTEFLCLSINLDHSDTLATHVFMCTSQASRLHSSFSALDRDVAHLFYIYGVIK
jgi:hypothetical protein